MSLADPARALATPAAGSGAHYRVGPMTLIAWCAVTGATLLGGNSALDAMSTDDLMRLVTVRDFLAGQGWFDVTQYRLDPPAGVSMHWSRLADVPIATLIAALSPTAGRAAAELIAVAFWPALLFLPVLVLAASIANCLAGRTAALAALLLVAVSSPVLVHFRPGGIDHHGLQLLLLLAATAGVMERDRPLASIGGGLAAAVSLAVGLEMLPALAAIFAAVGLRWAIEGNAAARATLRFGLAFAVGAAALFAATVPASNWSAPVCDAFSAPWLAAASLAGGALALLAAASARLKGRVARLATGIVAGTAVIAIFALAFPSCLVEPYAHLDPRMVELWLGSVYEAQSIIALVRNMPERVLPLYGATLAALMLGGLAMLRAKPGERILFLAPMLVLLALAAVALWQMRGAAAANLFAHVVLAAVLVRLIGDGTDSRSRVRLLVALLAISSPVLIMAGQGIGAAVAAIGPDRPIIVHDGPGNCRGSSDMAPLQTLAPGLVLSFVDLGPTILARTPHSVLAAPYHRNGAGNGAAFDMLVGDDATARRAFTQKQIGYVAVCPGAPDQVRYERFAPSGLAARLSRGEVPDYLDAVSTDPAAPLRVFRIRR